MSSETTINVRLSESLKSSGSKVLERNHISPSKLIRSVYQYMADNQEIPPCLDLVTSENESIYDKRRNLLDSIIRSNQENRLMPEDSIPALDDDTIKNLRHQRIEEKYGYLL